MQPMTRAELLRARSERLREVAEIDERLADIEERASATVGWISQSTSPLGKRRHLSLWRRLRDEGADGVKASGKLRLIRADVFDAALASADAAPRRRRAPKESGVDLAAAFGVAS